MARVVMVIDVPESSIDQLNDKLMDASDAHNSVQKLKNFLSGALSGAGKDMTIETTTRDTDVAVTTSGTNSKQETHIL